MAYNNFKLTTPTRYVSKAGNDSLAGTIDEPWRTPKNPVSDVETVIGAGVYSSFNILNGTNNGLHFVGDGNVIFDGFVRGGGNMVLRSMTVRDSNMNSGGSRALRLVDCKVKNTIITTSLTSDWLNNIFINCSEITMRISPGVTKFTEFNIFINCPACAFILDGTNNTFRSNYWDFNTALRWDGLPGNFRNNNIQGTLVLNTSGGLKSYAIQDQFTGTPQDNGYAAGVEWLTEAQLTADGYTGTISGWNAAVATCINRDPLFNDVTTEDFTLLASSPHIRAAFGGVQNIGGTAVGTTIFNTDEGNPSGTRVLPSTEIDTTIPTAYALKTGETQGFIDYVFKTNGRTIKKLAVQTAYNFDSDAAGGSADNNNVPDSQPLTAEYASLTATSGAPGTLNQLIVPAGLIVAGDHVRVSGQSREVLSVSNSGSDDTLTLSANLLAAIGAGVNVTFGTEEQIAALNPNRLTVHMRTRTSASTPTVPLIDSDWDNEVDPSYDVVGTFFQQEIDKQPGLIISGTDIWGSGDSDAPTGITPQELAPQWINVRVYLRNNYSSRGI